MRYTTKELRDTRMPLLRRLERMSEVKVEEKEKKDKEKKPKKEKNFTKLHLFQSRWILR